MASAPEAGEMNQSRFPRLQSCAHFHYEFTDIGPISVIAPERLFSYNSRPKWQKFAKNLIENIRETNGLNLCLQQFDIFKYKMCAQISFRNQKSFDLDLKTFD